jgi:lipid A 3-O-deacylase
MSAPSVRACRLFVLLLSMLVLAAAPLVAREPAMIAASAGQFDVFNKGNGGEIGVEMRFSPRRFRWLPRWVPDLSPVAGGMGTSRGTLFAYGGFRFELPLRERWLVSPSWAAGLYTRDGDGKDLGGALEFRSAIELSYRLGERSRLGLCLYHLSNAGLSGFNPGTESLVLIYSVRP